MARRSKAREVVVQMLHQVDANPDVSGQTVRAMIRERLPDDELRDFAWGLFAGVMENRSAIDERITLIATNWKLSRMAITDRNCLRLGAFELLHTETPPRVVIDEALELAKRFGNAQSSSFVNGILDKLIPSRDGEPERETTEE